MGMGMAERPNGSLGKAFISQDRVWRNSEGHER
jgi:hypothetical protein